MDQIRRFLQGVEKFVLHPWFGIILAILFTVGAWEMKANGANALLILAVAIFVISAFRVSGLQHLPILPRIGWTIFAGTGFALFLYHFLWAQNQPEDDEGPTVWLANLKIANVENTKEVPELEYSFRSQSKIAQIVNIAAMMAISNGPMSKVPDVPLTVSGISMVPSESSREMVFSFPDLRAHWQAIMDGTEVLYFFGNYTYQGALEGSTAYKASFCLFFNPASTSFLEAHFGNEIPKQSPKLILSIPDK